VLDEIGAGTIAPAPISSSTLAVYDEGEEDDELPLPEDVDDPFALLAPSPPAAVAVATLSPDAAAGAASVEPLAEPSFLSALSGLLSLPAPSALSLAGCVVEDALRLSLI